MNDDLERSRKLLGLVMLVGTLGVAGELALLGHYEEWRQWSPLVLLALGTLSTAAVLSTGARAAVIGHAVVMVAFLGSGLLGIFFHYSGNAEFEREMVPSIGGWELLKESLTGATPALAPGTMVLLGLVGLVIVYRHPALGPAQTGR